MEQDSLEMKLIQPIDFIPVLGFFTGVFRTREFNYRTQQIQWDNPELATKRDGESLLAVSTVILYQIAASSALSYVLNQYLS